MNKQPDKKRPEVGRKSRRAEALRRLGDQSATGGSGLAPDGASEGEQLQDTPGRPKSASSRQQTQPEQSSQTGSADLDAKKTS